jgi:hypothetical protein
MRSEIFISEIIWSYVGIRWSKETGKLGQITMKWPALVVVAAIFAIGGFIVG